MLERLEEVGVLARVDDMHAPPPLVAIGMPRSVRDVIERRLRRLSHATRQLLTLGAVIGREFSLSLVEALTDTAESAVLDALDEALASGMIVEEPGAPGSFAFAHAMIHEALYASITAARRVRMHHAIAEAIERRSAALAFPPLGELAHHFGEAALYKGVDKALYYAIRAGDRAAATLALEDAAFFYEKALRALDLLPPAQERSAERLELHLKQGRCSFGVGQWARARSAFESAISLLGPADDEVRCGVQVSLAETSFWLMDVPALRRHGAEAAALAARVGRGDLWADARAWMASALVADGDVLDGVRMDEEALARAGGARSFALARVPLTLYWVGRLRDAVAQATDAVGFARSSGNPAFLLYALQHLGLSLSGAGRYDEALQAFDEARTFGRTCGALPLLARATSMSVAPLLSLGHLDAAAGRAREARELGYRIGFEPSIVSAGIDLLLIFARSHDPGRAESLLGETTKAVRDASGWHAWKWNIRLSQVRAELALARGAWTEAIHAATQVVDQSQARHHLKYEVLGLATRARARLGVEARAAIVDARAAITLARNLGDPAVRLDCLGLLLDIDGSDAILDEAVQTVYGIVSAVTQPTLRSAFLASVCEKHPHVSRAHRQTNSEVPR
jgi:tetratricopeptide (TPR) repeat protein